MSLTGRRVQHFLKQQAADYRPIFGADEAGAQRVAAAAHVPGRRVVKAVVVCAADGLPLMAVVPATEHLDVSALAWITREDDLTLATPSQLEALFPDCAPGVVPPFGGLYGLPVYADACLRNVRELVLPAGDGRHTVAMSWREFDRLAVPIVAPLCLHHPPGQPA